MKIYGGDSIRDTMAQLSEAEVSGNTSLVRSTLGQLSDRDKFPAKALIFHEDARPGYFGTWTRSSCLIGPRTPLKRDVQQFDYGYDSGEDWEDEPAGDDIADDGEDEEEADDPDSEMDDWLVDDDETLDHTPEEDSFAESPIDISVTSHKRKAAEQDKKATKKRKVVVPLVPFVKGPMWEEEIGTSTYEPFEAYQIRFFNGMPPS
jgi:chromatin assembly factor 1 subunit A